MRKKKQLHHLLGLKLNCLCFESLLLRLWMTSMLMCNWISSWPQDLLGIKPQHHQLTSCELLLHHDLEVCKYPLKVHNRRLRIERTPVSIKPMEQVAYASNIKMGKRGRLSAKCYIILSRAFAFFSFATTSRAYSRARGIRIDPCHSKRGSTEAVLFAESARQML